MNRLTSLCALAAVVAVAACSDLPTTPSTTIVDAPAAARSRASDPTATWKIPLNAIGLAFQSDGLYGDGTYSVYANGVCTVSATIFATTAGSNSGDATIQTSAPKGRTCGRLFRFTYPGGATETVASNGNLTQLENTTYSIPIGTTVTRHLNLAPGTATCGTLHFGVGKTGAGTGSNEVNVTRVNSTTWHVVSQDAPNDMVMCGNTGVLYEARIDFTVVSSIALP